MFTDSQLEYIRKVARRQKNQGELSVAKYVQLHMQDSDSDLSTEQLDIVYYCAAECKRQMSGEMSVYDMLNGWAWMSTYNMLGKPRPIEGDFGVNVIETLGKWIEPDDNRNGFRQIAIGVGNQFFWQEKADWHEVPRLLKLLLESYYDGSLVADHVVAQDSIDEFYYQYEEIHPFKDGNGRTGKILYNYLRGTLSAPTIPPMFWTNGVP